MQDVRIIYLDEYIEVASEDFPNAEALAAEAKRQWPDIPDEFILRNEFRRGWSVVWAFDGSEITRIPYATVRNGQYRVTRSVREKGT